MRLSSIVRIAAAILVFMLPTLSIAQPGISEFYSASSEIRRYYFSFSDLVLVIGAITGIIGGLRIYSNWQSGKHQHIDAQVIGWFLSCLFLTLVGTFLRGLYGI